MKDGDSKAGGDRLFDGAVVAEFETAPDIRFLVAKEFFRGEACAGSDFPLDKDLSRQPLDRDPACLGQGMGRCPNDDEFLRKKRLGHMGDPLRRPPHEDEIHLVLEEPVSQGRTVGNLQADRDARMSLLKQTEDGREDIRSSGAHGSKGDPSSFEPVKLFHHHLGVVEELMDLLGVREKRLARLGQHNGPARPFEEGCPDCLSKLTDLDGDRRLTQIELLGSPRVASVAGNGEKDSELVKGHMDTIMKSK